MDALFVGQSERQGVPDNMKKKDKVGDDFPGPDPCMEVMHMSHPLIICYFGKKIMTICADCYEEIQKLKIDGDKELLKPLSLTINVLQNKLISSISEGVTNGNYIYIHSYLVSQIFYVYENWMISVGDFDAVNDNFNATVCTKIFHLFQKVVFDSLYIIVSSSSLTSNDLVENADKSKDTKSFQNIHIGNGASAFEKIKILFLECFYSFLDGLEYIVSNSNAKDSSSIEDIDISQENGLPFKLSCSKVGSIVLEDSSSGAKLRSKAELNRDQVIYFK
jgi:hypothetical protein